MRGHRELQSKDGAAWAEEEYLGRSLLLALLLVYSIYW
jgi:hypothetical protein